MSISEENVQRIKLVLRGCLRWGLKGLVAGALLGFLLIMADEGQYAYVDEILVSVFLGGCFGGALGAALSVGRDFVRWVNTD